MSQWAQHFTPAGPSASNFATQGTVAPEDIVLSRVWEELQTSALLVTIFGTRFDLMSARDEISVETTPRIQVYHFSVENDQGPTRGDNRDVEINVNIRYQMYSIERQVLYGGTLASVRAEILRVLNQNKGLLVTIPGGDEIEITSNMVTLPVSWPIDVVPAELHGGEATAYHNMELAFLWTVKVTHNTQKIDTLVRAGIT